MAEPAPTDADDELFDFVGTWYVRHADGTTEDIVLTHGNLLEDTRGTCGQFILARRSPAADPSPTEQHHRWRATGGNGTASIVSRIGGPAFAVMRHGNPDVAIAEMVAAALNECPWLTIPAAGPAPKGSSDA